MTHGGGERREANPFLPSVDGSYYWDVAGYTVLYCITGVLGNDVGNDMEGEEQGNALLCFTM